MAKAEACISSPLLRSQLKVKSMMIKTNQEMYSTWEFNRWAYGESLDPDDRFLFEQYLDKDSKTLEAGTGGGRLVLGMQELGFTSLYGFDFVPEFIATARQRDQSHQISFEVQDATHLSYRDDSFDQIVYLQNMISSIEGEANRLEALKEAYRILRHQGIGLFSFLNFYARAQTPMYWLYINYLRLFRLLSGSDRCIQEQPWLKPGGKPNLAALLDRGPYVYWYRVEEMYHLLQGAGFRILALGSSYQIRQGTLPISLEALLNQPIAGGLYFVCSK